MSSVSSCVPCSSSWLFLYGCGIYFNVLEETFTIFEWVEMSSSILFVHSLSGELLGDHVSHNSHHSGTSIVEFGIKLAGLLLWVKDVVTEITNSIVAIVLGCWQPGKLNKTNEGNNLCKSSCGNREKSINSCGDIREFKVVGWGDVSVENNVVVVDNCSNNGSHGNATVFTLNGTTALERLRLSCHPSERIKDSKGFSCTKFKFTDSQRGCCPLD
mmetsp:Transcript_3299/g.4622  ORF Transcript_3299/g.4622 Transcript_3299/m.4622 type:complete len:215 (+) Transcript_3299:470-1114(+)